MKNIEFLNQSRFPFLWNLFQQLIGGTTDKRRIYKDLQKNTGKNILEIGCSTGNTADAFRKVQGLSYVGLDIDSSAIAEAQRAFRGESSFQFVCADLREFSKNSPSQFDFILFGNMAHHVPDGLLIELLSSAAHLMHNKSLLAIVDPLKPGKEEPWLVRFYAQHLEKGQFLRSWQETEDIINSLERLQVVKAEKLDVGATPLSWPLCARFSSHLLQLKS